MRSWRLAPWLAATLVLGCTPPRAVEVRPQMDPAPLPSPTEPRQPSSETPPVAPADDAKRSLPPEEAARRGLMPLASTGVPQFASAMPQADGRGVVIAILDSGIDPSVPGLQRTTDGTPKLLDARDFSGEGRVPLAPIVRRGDTLLVHGQRILGASRIAAVAVGATWWGGVFAELPLGPARAADANGNGTVGDALPVVVVRTTNGWALFADTQGNGTFADDRPIRDYATAQEYFGWSSTIRPPSTQMAVNFADSAGTPTLDLVFDTSAHGTHVAGIAAGHGLYGVAGFDGVAPGARLLGLKIANDAGGGITVTGAMIRALDYAIRFAAERQLALVVNISFGVGNEREGASRIDALVDSVLTVHPNVVVAVAAANDGPALSTIGFPGTAMRVLSVGATQPLVFNGVSATDSVPEPLADFSSRGGEVAGPDLVTPGTAYSAVPNFAIGDEIESGTSMAAPHAAGLAARLLSALGTRATTTPATLIIQALRNSAQPVPGATTAEQGAGRPDLLSAWRWLERRESAAALVVDVADGVQGRGAVWITLRDSADGTRPVRTQVTLRQIDAGSPPPIRLDASAPWIVVPAATAMSGGKANFTATVTAGRRNASGWIRVSDARDGSLLALVPVTVRLPISATALTVVDTFTVAAGGTTRIFVPAEAGRGFQVEVATAEASQLATAALHEPGGMPFREGAMSPSGFGDGAALFELTGNDVVAGLYEVVVAGGPLAGATMRVTVRRAPLTLDATLTGDSLRVTTTSVVAARLSVRTRAGMIGGEWRQRIERSGDAPVRLVIPVPEWAERVSIDSRMPRDQWLRFTDFGVTIQDKTGRHIDALPLNYAFGRATPELPPHVIGDSLVILLAPGFAERAGEWALDVAVRFYAADVTELDSGGSPFAPLAGRATVTQRYSLGVLPLKLPVGFRPVVILVALEGDEHAWTREVTLDIAGGTSR
ncbi:MAG: S8 family serine peptidase [Gemmatimonadales bacterium]|nr:S8 family serine peptidase [Gemmatimonadales bacterium]